MVSHSGRKWCWLECHFIRHNCAVEFEHVKRFANHSARTDVALLALRIASGLAFFYHGAAILFGMFGGPGPEHFAIDHHFPCSAISLGWRKSHPQLLSWRVLSSVSRQPL